MFQALVNAVSWTTLQGISSISMNIRKVVAKPTGTPVPVFRTP